MNEMQKQALPGYKDLAEQVKKQSEAIKQFKDSQEQTNDLLALLAQCHIDTDNPDENRGYLEQLLLVAECSKKHDKRHRSIGARFTITALVFAAIALAVEVSSKGEMPLFTTIWTYAKGVFL